MRRVSIKRNDAPLDSVEAYDTDDAYDADEEFDDGYGYSDEAYAYDEQGEQLASGGLFGSPGRAITLVFSMLLLLVVGASVLWLLGTRSPGTIGTATFGSSSSTNIDISSLSVAPRTGSIAPDFGLIDVHTNKPVKLSSLRGKPVFINFWGTWCPPCRAEMPEMQKLYDKYKGQFEMVSISMGPRDDPTKVQVFVDAAKYNWTFIHDPDYAVATTYQVQAIPSSFFIDKSGVIRSVYVGAMNGPQMENNLQQAR